MRAIADKSCVSPAHEKGAGSVKSGRQEAYVVRYSAQALAPLVSSYTASGGVRSTTCVAPGECLRWGWSEELLGENSLI